MNGLLPGDLGFAGKAVLMACVLLTAPVAAQSRATQPGAADVLALIEANGGFAFAAAAADMGAAKARLEEARAHLFPRADAVGQVGRYESASPRDTGRTDAYGSLEVVQPLYDFGRTDSRIKAARSEVTAAEADLRVVRDTVMLEGLAVFFDLWASDLAVRALNEDHSHAYVRWVRAKERQALNQKSPLEVAEWLARVERTRLALYRERSRNDRLRVRIEELTGRSFDAELIGTPPAPSAKPAQVPFDALAAAVERRNPEVRALFKRAEAMGFRVEGTGSRPAVEAYATAGSSNRDLRGREKWAFGARLTWPLFDGGLQGAEKARLTAERRRLEAELESRIRRLRREARAQWRHRADSWQRIVAARAQLDFAKKNLLRRQRRYAQERVADLGRAMIEATVGEVELIRAIGAFHVESARLAVLLGEGPGKGLEEAFVEAIIGVAPVTPGDGFIPKTGSGFGQDDQNKIN